MVSLWGFGAKPINYTIELFFFFLSQHTEHTHSHSQTHTHSYSYHHLCQHAQTSRSGSSGENFPDDILCFMLNIDARGKAAGGLLVTFCVTLEGDAKLYTCSSSWGKAVEGRRGGEGVVHGWMGR